MTGGYALRGHLCAAALACALLCVGVTPLFAQAPPAEVTTATPPALEEGERFFNNGDFPEAVAALSEVGGGASDPHWVQAQALMARSFDALGMGQLALTRYAQVLKLGPSHPAFEQAFNASAALSRFMEDDGTFAEAVAGLASEQLPALERSYGLYVAGDLLFQRERYDASIAFLGAVPRGDALFVKARLQMAKGLVMIEQRPMALAVLSDLAENEAAGVAALPDGKSLVNLNIARMAYGMGLFDQAADAYARVDRRSPYWADALMERAWANYALWQSQDSEQALSSSLGALMSLTSPSMESLYYPEAWLLQAQIFFLLCKSNTGNAVTEQFMERFAGLGEGLTGALPSASADPRALYEAVNLHLAGHTQTSGVPDPFLNLFKTDPSFARLEAHLGRIDSEAALVNRQRRAWGGGLDSALLAELNSHSEAMRRARGEAIAMRLSEESQLLTQTLVATELAQLEMLTQQVNLYEAAAAGRVSMEQKKKRRWAAPADRRVWPFEGEFWLDEVGYYQVDTRDECANIREF